MATPVYPATNNAEAIELNISNANQFFTILHGGVDDYVETYEGHGVVPSVAKALHEATAYKPPLPWLTSGEEVDLLQTRVFEGGAYAPLEIPAPFSERPSNNYWRLLQTNVVKSNVEATTDPTVNDDETKGYSINSLWINKATEDVFRCLDATEGEAVWVKASLDVDDLGTLALGDTAADVPYDNTASGLNAENAQSAIDEVAASVEAIGIDSLDDLVPPGVIWMWSGTIPNIPPGWALCDGSNGTPDLRNRFVVGAGNSYAVGATGGSKDAILVSHSHSATASSSGSHSHSGTTSSAGNHRHLGASYQYTGDSSWNKSYGSVNAGTTRHVSQSSNNRAVQQSYGSTTGAHSHSISTNATGAHSHTVTVTSAGESGTDKNLPPYYALAFIMRLAWS